MDILPAHSIFGVQMFCIRTLVKENDGKRKEVQSMHYDGPFNVVHLVWSRHEKVGTWFVRELLRSGVPDMMRSTDRTPEGAGKSCWN